MRTSAKLKLNLTLNGLKVVHLSTTISVHECHTLCTVSQKTKLWKLE